MYLHRLVPNANTPSPPFQTQTLYHLFTQQQLPLRGIPCWYPDTEYSAASCIVSRLHDLLGHGHRDNSKSSPHTEPRRIPGVSGEQTILSGYLCIQLSILLSSCQSWHAVSSSLWLTCLAVSHKTCCLISCLAVSHKTCCFISWSSCQPQNMLSHLRSSCKSQNMLSHLLSSCKSQNMPSHLLVQL